VGWICNQWGGRASTTKHLKLVNSGWCLAQPGREYVVFQNQVQPFTLEIAGAKSPLKGGWFNPHSGKRTAAGSFDNGTANLTPPADWGKAPLVLHLKSAN
jgi:hypothetical protein